MHEPLTQPWTQGRGLERLGAVVPHVDQYVGPWAVLESAFNAALDLVGTPELLAAHVQAFDPASAAGGVAGRGGGPHGFGLTDSGVAVIQMRGAMTKHGSSLGGLPFGTVGVRRAVREAARDTGVKAVLLVIDSPGGTVSGTGDLADEVARAAASKPVTAFIEDTGASAAFWVASQATRTVANAHAVVGSIGTFMVIDDLSGLFAREGVRTHVVRAGDFKGAGTRGTEVTAGHLAEFQRVVNEINDLFVAAVARGRGLSLDAARALADGRVHVGQKAVGLGLIDAVETFDGALSALESGSAGNKRRTAVAVSAAAQTQEMAIMPESTNTPNAIVPQPQPVAVATPQTSQAATYEQIVAACPGADAQFVCDRLAAKSSVDQARHNWMLTQQARLEARDKELAEAKQKAEALANTPGVDRVGTAGGTGAASDASGDPVQAWDEAVGEKLKRGMSKPKAISAVARENPELRGAYIGAWNQRHGRGAG